MAETRHKVVIVGDPNVGKSCIFSRQKSGSFEEITTATLSSSYATQIVEVDDQKIYLQIWDTAGAEQFMSITSMYFRGASAAIVVYDVTKEESFREVQKWIQLLRENAPDDCILALCGNKIDLVDLVEVKPALAKEFAVNQDILIFQETSAKNNVGLDQLFNLVAKEISKKPPPRDRNNSVLRRQDYLQNDSEEDDNNNKKCCLLF